MKKLLMLVLALALVIPSACADKQFEDRFFEYSVYWYGIYDELVLEDAYTTTDYYHVGDISIMLQRFERETNIEVKGPDDQLEDLFTVAACALSCIDKGSKEDQWANMAQTYFYIRQDMMSTYKVITAGGVTVYAKNDRRHTITIYLHWER